MRNSALTKSSQYLLFDFGTSPLQLHREQEYLIQKLTKCQRTPFHSRTLLRAEFHWVPTVAFRSEELISKVLKHLPLTEQELFLPRIISKNTT